MSLVHEKVVEVPQVQLVEIMKQQPKVQYQERLVQVEKIQVEGKVSEVEVPHVVVQDFSSHRALIEL